MKKIVAVWLTLAMLLGLWAVAEPAPDLKTALVTGMSDVVLTTTDAHGYVNTLGLQGLSATFTIDTSNALRVMASVDHGQENLFSGIAELVDNRLRFSFSGAQRTFETVLPPIGGVDPQALPILVRAALPSMMNINHLPQIDGLSIPRVDLKNIVSAYGSKTVGNTTEFSIPADIVNALLNQFNQAIKESEVSFPRLSQLTGMLDLLFESGIGLALTGTITDSDAEQTAAISAFLCSEGQTAEQPTFFLNTNSTENNFTLAVDLPSEDEGSYTIAQLSLMTAPASNTLDVGLTVAGMASLTLKLYKQSGLQVADLNFGMPNESISSGLSLRYGRQLDQDYIALSGNASGAGSFELTGTGATDSEGMYSGNAHYTFRGALGGIDLSAVYFEFLDDYSVGGYALPAEVVPAMELTSEEVKAAIEPLTNYVAAVRSGEIVD